MTYWRERVTAMYDTSAVPKATTLCYLDQEVLDDPCILTMITDVDRRFLLDPTCVAIRTNLHIWARSNPNFIFFWILLDIGALELLHSSVPQLDSGYVD